MLYGHRERALTRARLERAVRGFLGPCQLQQFNNPQLEIGLHLSQHGVDCVLLVGSPSKTLGEAFEMLLLEGIDLEKL